MNFGPEEDRDQQRGEPRDQDLAQDDVRISACLRASSALGDPLEPDRRASP